MLFCFCTINCFVLFAVYICEINYMNLNNTHLYTVNRITWYFMFHNSRVLLKQCKFMCEKIKTRPLDVTIHWFTEICVSYLTGPFMIICRIEFVLRDVFSQPIIKVDSLLMKALLLALCLNCWNWETITWISLAPFIWINLELQPWLIL